MSQMSDNKIKLIEFFNKIAPRREYWQKKNKYYYQNQVKFFKYHIPENASILEIGCGLGDILNELKPKRGLGIDISPAMIELAKKRQTDRQNLEFKVMDAENLLLEEKFDYIIISDTIGYIEDIQKVFQELKKVTTNYTRIFITYHSFLWLPLLKLTEILGGKMPQKRLNWLNSQDIANLLYLENYDIIKMGRRFLCPKKLFFLGNFINRYLANLPLINRLCLYWYTIARLVEPSQGKTNVASVSVVVPVRNEKGNIEKALERIPLMGNQTEIIFVEGGSTDGSWQEIIQASQLYVNKFSIKYFKQDGRGKADAVKKGLSVASGDILMILDADLTMPPENLPKFFEALVNGKGEFINGSRLVYPLGKEAMRTLNMLGNKFFSLMFSWLLGQRLKDTLCGTKAILRENYQRLLAVKNSYSTDPFGDFDLIFGAARLNLKIVEIPIRYQARGYGETNITRFKHGWQLLKILFLSLNKVKFI